MGSPLLSVPNTENLALTVLVVEDHTPSRDALKMSLEDWSHNVFTAVSGDEALRILQEQPEIRVLLTDWRLPGMDGLELCRRVRDQRGRFLYIIVMTARNERGDRSRALEAGADGFIDKPLDLHELQSQIAVAARIRTLEFRLGEEISKLTDANADLKEEYETRETIRSLGIKLAGELKREALVHSFLEAATQLVSAQSGIFVPNDAKPDGIFCLPAVENKEEVLEWTERFCCDHDGLLMNVTSKLEDDSPAPVRSLLVAPLFTASGGRLGTLYLTHSIPEQFNERSQRVIQGLAAQASVALDSARLYEASVEIQRRLREKNRELKERLRQLDALRAESEATQQNLDQVLSGIQEAFVLLGPNLRFLYFNQQASLMAGSPWEQMEGRSYWEIFPDFVGSELDDALQQVAEKRAPARLEEYYGERGRYYEHRIHPASEGRITIFSTDITEAKKAELAARKTELWLRAIFHQTSGFFAILHPDGEVAQINQAFLDSVGYAGEQIEERPIWEAPWWPDEEQERLHQSLTRVSHGERVREVVTYRLDDATERSMDRTLTPILDEVGQIRYLLAEGLDISDLKRTEQELATARDQALLANRMKSQFLANMSHEIRTPLSGIQGMTEFLQETHLNEAQLEYVDAISRCSHGLLAIVGDVLDLSRIEAGELEIRETAYPLERTVRDLVSLFNYRANEKNIKLTCQFSPELPQYVVGDPDRLRQILVNLVNNAIKFTDLGFVGVEVKPGHRGDSNSVLFEVHDSGVGIALEEQDKLFKPFSQLDSTPSRRHGGTGLGLSIVKKLVELMDGSVGCRSEFGSGSTFWFELPLPAGQEPSGEEGAPALETSPLLPDLTPHLKVLLAEDSPINRRVVLLQLERSGVKAQAVCNGLEVLEVLEKESFHIILMDCQMPELDGYQTATRIRKKGDHETVILALTAHALKGEREKCLAAGMDDYMVKPLSIEGLQELLARWSQSSRISPRILKSLPSAPRV